MSKRFRAIKQEFKNQGFTISNRDVRSLFHYEERSIKMTQRVHNSTIDYNTIGYCQVIKDTNEQEIYCNQTRV